ncbi:MAG: hypothetical protein WBP79_01135, partial [Candidatus Acidiferrales bacterium]
EAHIALHWKEEEIYQPSKKFIEQANHKDPKVMERFSEKNLPKCFEEYADILTWDQRWHSVLDTNDPPHECRRHHHAGESRCRPTNSRASAGRGTD